MKIRSLLNLTSLSSLAMVVVMVVALGYSSIATRRANAELGLAEAIRATLLEQAIVRDEYLNRRESRAKYQLAAKSRLLADQIQKALALFREPQEATILADMDDEAQGEAAINQKIMANLELPLSAERAGDLGREYDQMLIGQLLIKSYLLDDSISRIIDRQLATLGSLKRSNDLALAGILCVFAVLVLINALMIDKILSKGIKGLLSGASNIGGGDLAYRLPVDSDDEIAEVAREINRMASALMGSFTSIAGLEERVALRTAELDESNKELEAFAYSVAHDLRAPLRSIDGFSHILQEELGPSLDEENARFLGVVREGARKMDSLITSLLELSRLGQTGLSRISLDMASMARASFGLMAEPDIASDFRFIVGGLPEAQADRSMMERVWANLLSNAIKYSLPSPIHEIEVGGFEDAGMRVYFVRDRGVGFDPLYADKLFGMFQRLHDQRDFAGNGVGLAIVQRIVHRHGGRVWAQGRPGEGATFYFSLP
jgi:signal transduction histidine kinase